MDVDVKLVPVNERREAGGALQDTAKVFQVVEVALAVVDVDVDVLVDDVVAVVVVDPLVEALNTFKNQLPPHFCEESPAQEVWQLLEATTAPVAPLPVRVSPQ